MVDGIYILANDVVLDQLIALVNSIEKNAGRDYPICIVPYDDRLENVKDYLAKNPHISLFSDRAVIETWEQFAAEIWQSHPGALADWERRGISGVSRMGMHRRFCGFDGPFDRFIYLDADILVMGPLEPIFAQLDHHDWVVYDFQYKDPSHVYDVTSPKLHQVFSPQRIETEIFCAGLYATKRGVFSAEQRQELLQDLKAGEAEILYFNGPDQSIVNYMVMKSGLDSYNLAHHLPPDVRTGCCVTSPHFEAEDAVLYDKGNRLTYLHYIGVSSGLITRVCAGENLDFPYQDIFLHYRYLKQPEARPQFKGPKQPYGPTRPSLWQRAARKVKSTVHSLKG